MNWLSISSRKQKKPDSVYIIEIETLNNGLFGYDTETYPGHINYIQTPETILVASVEPSLRILKGDFVGCNCVDGGEFLISRSVIKTVNIMPAINTSEDAKSIDAFIADNIEGVKVIGWYNYWKDEV